MIPIIKSVNHAAYRCRDVEQTRRFYEGVLGLKVKAALAFDQISGTGFDRRYMHIFFEMADGNYIAFFDSPDDARVEHFERKDSFDVHIALEVENEAALLELQSHIQACGKTCLGPVDHGFLKSCYMYDPNGLQVEITARTANSTEILDHEESQIEVEISRWTESTRQLKQSLFGQDVFDK